MPDTTFQATISPVKNAVAFDGQDGAHVHFDIPDEYAVNVALLVAARNKVVTVKVEWGEEEEDA